MPSPHWTRAVWVSRRPLSAKTALIWRRRCEFLSTRNGDTTGRALVTVTVVSSLPVSPAASVTARLRVRVGVVPPGEPGVGDVGVAQLVCRRRSTGRTAAPPRPPRWRRGGRSIPRRRCRDRLHRPSGWRGRRPSRSPGRCGSRSRRPRRATGFGSRRTDPVSPPARAVVNPSAIAVCMEPGELASPAERRWRRSGSGSPAGRRRWPPVP